MDESKIKYMYKRLEELKEMRGYTHIKNKNSSYFEFKETSSDYSFRVIILNRYNTRFIQLIEDIIKELQEEIDNI